MRRRDFVKVAGLAAAWPLTARAQQAPIPVVGFINASSARNFARQLAAFIKGLGEIGYVDGRNVAVEYRWAEDQNDRLPTMAADLVHRALGLQLHILNASTEHDFDTVFATFAKLRADVLVIAPDVCLRHRLNGSWHCDEYCIRAYSGCRVVARVGVPYVLSGS
jgi:hypothetical protein